MVVSELQVTKVASSLRSTQSFTQSVCASKVRSHLACGLPVLQHRAVASLPALNRSSPLRFRAKELMPDLCLRLPHRTHGSEYAITPSADRAAPQRICQARASRQRARPSARTSSRNSGTECRGKALTRPGQQRLPRPFPWPHTCPFLPPIPFPSMLRPSLPRWPCLPCTPRAPSKWRPGQAEQTRECKVGKLPAFLLPQDIRDATMPLSRRRAAQHAPRVDPLCPSFFLQPQSSRSQESFCFLRLSCFPLSLPFLQTLPKNLENLLA